MHCLIALLYAAIDRDYDSPDTHRQEVSNCHWQYNRATSLCSNALLYPASKLQRGTAAGLNFCYSRFFSQLHHQIHLQQHDIRLLIHLFLSGFSSCEI
ncbi:hypothetical protein NC652_039814 [Populus alba x Populus x berolinensis]|nr:hypothetical protein NC652_039814 [Populus alba x Populus x berolinensis]